MENILNNSAIENLVLFRHGKAQKIYDAADDFSRELTERGQRDAENQAIRLKDAGFTPDVALVSSAARAFQTWQKANLIFPDCREIVLDRLYLAAPRTYLKEVVASGAKNVVLIAHDPGLHELCRYFMLGGGAINPENVTNEEAMLLFELPTAGVAWFTRDESAKNGMTLKKYFKPIKLAQ
jgi:phosphohistidine phosphatase